MLYDALVNPDSRNSWAHDVEKLPNFREGKKTEIWRGKIVWRIRTWDIRLKVVGYFASVLEPGVAWRCPNALRGWRRDGERGLWVFALVNLYNYCMVCISAFGMHCREFGYRFERAMRMQVLTRSVRYSFGLLVCNPDLSDVMKIVELKEIV